MVNRTNKQQTKHDDETERLAQYYQNRNYNVEADIKGFKQPATIGKRRPDIIAKNGKEKVIVEVETPDSVEKDKNQQAVFKNYADSHKNVRFWTKVAK